MGSSSRSEAHIWMIWSSFTLDVSKVKSLAAQKELCLSGCGGPNLWPAEWYVGCHWLVGELGYLLLYCTSRNVAMVLAPHIFTHINLKVSLGDCTMEPALNASFSEVHNNVSRGREVQFICPKDRNKFMYSPWKVTSCVSKLNKYSIGGRYSVQRKKTNRSAHVIRMSARLADEDYAENCI